MGYLFVGPEERHLLVLVSTGAPSRLALYYQGTGQEASSWHSQTRESSKGKAHETDEGAQRGWRGSRSGYHLTRYTPDAQGQPQSAAWTFPNLYDLLVFAQAQGFDEMNAEADDWQSASEPPTA